MRFPFREFGSRVIIGMCLGLLCFAAVATAQDQVAPRGGPCDPCDTNCDLLTNELDIIPFIDALLNDPPGCSPCRGDFDDSGTVDGLDMQPFVDCLLAPPVEITGNMTAYRPQHGAAYFPFTKTAVSDIDQEDDARGPGIRVNAPGDNDPFGEDDLIEVLLEIDQPGGAVALRRSNGNLRVWTTRTKVNGTEIPFVGDTTTAMLFGPGETTATVWVEWAVAEHGTADLQLEPAGAGEPIDMLRFHSFRSIVTALGGEGQVPSVPVDANNGTAVVAVGLYAQGFDVHLYDEDNVAPDGSGPAYNEVVNAIQNRLVDEVAIYGYSHGGGSTYDLAERLDVNRAGIGIFEILFTSYVDAVENDSDVDLSQELRRPPSTGYHANHYQNGRFSDFFLDGGPVPNSNPPPTGLNVETTPWGAGSTHFQVDDFIEVRSFIEMNLLSSVTP